MSRKTKIYIRMTIAFTLIFVLLAAVILGAFWVKDYLYGSTSDLNDKTMQKSYVNALLCGVDKDGYRTDVLIFAQMNLITNTINMVQIPRDTYVDINHIDKKINSAYGYNKEEQLFKEVSYILPGVEIDKYMLVNIKSFREIIDAIGGVEFNVPANLKYDDPYQDLHIDLSKGMQNLNGKKAEQLVRFRKDNDGNDIETLLGISRVEMQREFIYTAIDQILSIKNVLKVPKLISIATDNVTTNFTYDDFAKYAPMVLKIGTDSFNIMSLPGEDRYEYGAWYFIHDRAATSQMIKQYLTPERDEISTQELAIRDQLIGDDSETNNIPQGLVLENSFFNRFLTVDIIDGSSGKADIDGIVADIEKYGFTVKKINDASTVNYSKSVVIAKKDNDSGAKIAKAIGMDSFIINEDKGNGTTVTVIVGSDMNDK